MAYLEMNTSYEWYAENGYKVPRLQIYGPYQDGEGVNYTNMTLGGSDWTDYDKEKPLSIQATFRDEDLIKLRDHLNEHFPVNQAVLVDNDLDWIDDLSYDLDDNELLDAENPEEEIVDAVELEDDDDLELFEVEYDFVDDEWGVYELTYEKIASFRDEKEALDYALYRTETYED